MAIFSNESAKLAMVLLAVVATPVVSGLFAGLAKRMRLRRDGGMEAAIMQPFYDFNHLIRQQTGPAGNTAQFAILLQLAFSLLALALIVLQRNLLSALLLQSFSGLMAIAANGVRPVGEDSLRRTNPWKLFLTYQPVVLLAAAGCSLAAGGFGIDAMLGLSRQLIVELPLLWLSLLYVAYVSSLQEPDKALRGPLLAVERLAGCFRQAILLVFAGVMASDSLIMAGLVAVLLGYGLVAAEDLRGRLHWRLMAAWSWEFVYFACAINLSWLYIKYLL
jgi:ech hydrogenase subunit B